MLLMFIRYKIEAQSAISKTQYNFKLRIKIVRKEMNICTLFLQKVKELTYMHSEGIMAGELKHGPLALIDKAMPLIMIVTRDPVYIVSICLFK